jgi:hypothetical protein
VREPPKRQIARWLVITPSLFFIGFTYAMTAG